MMIEQTAKPVRLMSLKENRFPKQVRLGNRSVAWVESEVEEFITSAINSRGNKERAA